jgi:hypothetical protein
VAAVILAIAVAGCTANPPPTGSPGSGSALPSVGLVDDGSAPPAGSPGPGSAPRPTAGHELYGFLPYWEMDDPGISEHVDSLPLTTLALFSVTHTAKGGLNTRAPGYPLVTGDVGKGLIADAHGRGARVEVVYSSFGSARNRRLLEDASLQASIVTSLVALVRLLGVDGVDVDIEALDPTLVPAYGAFLTHLREGVRAVRPTLTVSAATGAHVLGAAMAVAAAQAGVDRIFMMGYDYRTAGSEPGASAPLDRSDGEPADLRSSLDLYAALGVPADRLLLGLPLYGVDWPVAGPLIGAPSTGRGRAWFPRAHADVLTDPAIVPQRDGVEQVDVYFSSSDGLLGAPSPSPGASVPLDRAWRAVYVDTPGTLAPKLNLANERALAGAGFWAVGYTRGLPAYTDLMDEFASGQPLP